MISRFVFSRANRHWIEIYVQQPVVESHLSWECNDRDPGKLWRWPLDRLASPSLHRPRLTKSRSRAGKSDLLWSALMGPGQSEASLGCIDQSEPSVWVHFIEEGVSQRGAAREWEGDGRVEDRGYWATQSGLDQTQSLSSSTQVDRESLHH